MGDDIRQDGCSGVSHVASSPVDRLVGAGGGPKPLTERSSPGDPASGLRKVAFHNTAGSGLPTARIARRTGTKYISTSPAKKKTTSEMIAGR